MKVFVSCAVLVCCAGILHAASVTIENSETEKKVEKVDKEVESDAKQDVKRSLSHESSPITITASSGDGWAPEPPILSGSAGHGWAPEHPVLPPSVSHGWAPEQPILPAGALPPNSYLPPVQVPVHPQQGYYGVPAGQPHLVATNTDTLTTIRQNVPVPVPVDRPYPVYKNIPVDRPYPV